MPASERPVILNQLGLELGKTLEEHPSQPVMIQDSFPAEPWKIVPEADILVTGGFANWKQAPRDWRFPERLRWVQSQTTGIEIYPPTLLQDRVMTCGRGLNALPIAEFVFAAILRSEKWLEETRARSEGLAPARHRPPIRQDAWPHRLRKPRPGDRPPGACLRHECHGQPPHGVGW